MLNTDLHNPSIKKKMTVEEFIKNQRGINNGKDLPRVIISTPHIRNWWIIIWSTNNYKWHKKKGVFGGFISSNTGGENSNEDCTYPNALKRGYLSRERHAKVYQKVWCILDVPSTSFYIFKSETVCYSLLMMMMTIMMAMMVVTDRRVSIGDATITDIWYS